MRICSAFCGGLFIMTVLFLCRPAQAATEWHIGGGSGTNHYDTLEDFRLAVETSAALLMDGDVVYLYGDDDSLTKPFDIHNQSPVTFRSAGNGQHTISASDRTPAYFSILGLDSNLIIENLILDGKDTGQGFGVEFEPLSSGSLSISDSTIQNMNYGVFLSGDVIATFTNTTFTNNQNVNALYISNLQGESTQVNVVVNQDTPGIIAWESDHVIGSTIDGRDVYGPAIDTTISGSLSLNFNIAAGNTLDVRGTITGGHRDGEAIQLEKGGEGILKLDEVSVATDSSGSFYGNFDFKINAGTVHFTTDGNNTYYTDPFGSITVKDGAVFKPTLHPGNLERVWLDYDETWVGAHNSIFYLNEFNTEEGARLEIGGASLFPAIGTTHTKEYIHTSRVIYGIMMLTDAPANAYATIASTMNINNTLLEANLVFCELGSDGSVTLNGDPESQNGIAIEIVRLENLSILDGVGEYADVYRKMDFLTEPERDMLDGIYARGGLTRSDRAFLQTLSGTIVTNSLLGMRHNWSNLLKKINRRITDFQHEELLELEISGDDFCRYSDENPVNDYLKMWAGIDQSWANQRDSFSLAGYEYNPYGIHLGLERHCENIIVGGVARFDDGAMKLKANHSTKTDITTVMASVYASYATEGMYITGSVSAGYGWNESRSNYRLPGISATAKTGNYATTLYGAQLELGYMYETEIRDLPLRVTPYGGLAYAKLHRQAATESGGGNLDKHFRRGDWDLWEPSAGVRVAMPINRGGYWLVPTADVAWVRTIGDPRNDGGDAWFLADPSAAWGNSILTGNQSALRVSGGLAAHFGRNLDMNLVYDLEMRSHFTSHQLNFNVAYGF